MIWRVSTIEAFRRLIATDYGDEAALIERLRAGQWTPGPTKWQMEAGTAWHRALAGTPPDAEHGEGLSRYGDYLFANGNVSGGREYAGPGLVEVTGRLPFGGHVIEGTADHIRGCTIQDHKTCFSAPDVKQYENSLQWRFYLLIHHCDQFTYDLWDFREPRGGYCELRGVQSFRFYRYEGMEGDCRRWLKLFFDWAGAHGLSGEPKQEAA